MIPDDMQRATAEIPPEVPARLTRAPEDPHSTEPQLSVEEQMANFEEALKEEDWGHQPC